MFSAGMVTGFDRIGETTLKVEVAAAAGARRGAGVILAEAERRAPRGATGAIVRDLAIRAKANGRLTIGTEDVRESRFMEHGTRFVRARPFLRPAAELGRAALVEAETAEIRAACG